MSILNKSEVFKYRINHVDKEEQNDGQGDYKEVKSDNSYEATLLLNSKIVEEVIKNEKFLGTVNFIKWINNKIENEFRQALKRKHDKENIIIFNIFPQVAPKFRESLTDKFMPDSWDYIINEIEKSNPKLLEEKELIMVSFNIDNSFYVKRLLSNNKFGIKYITDYSKNIFPFKIIDINK